MIIKNKAKEEENMKYKFEINQKLPSLNEYTKACRTNKFIGAQMKQEVETQIWADIKQQLKGIKVEGPVRINFIWVEENKKRDLDNICFAKKFVLDALVKTNVLANDTQNYVIGFSDTFEYNKKGKVIVELEEI